MLQLTCQPLLLPVHRGLSLHVCEEGGEQNTTGTYTHIPPKQPAEKLAKMTLERLLLDLHTDPADS